MGLRNFKWKRAAAALAAALAAVALCFVMAADSGGSLGASGKRGASDSANDCNMQNAFNSADGNGKLSAFNGENGYSELDAYSGEFFSLGTIITVTVYAADGEFAAGALDAAESVFRRVHGEMGRFEAGGDVYRINAATQQEKPVKVGEETFALLQRAIGYCAQSGGAFDIGIGAASDLWGFGGGVGPRPDGQLQYLPDEQTPPSPDERKPPSAGDLAAALNNGGYDKIILDGRNLTVGTPAGLVIDLGGIAKGYATQAAVEALKKYGVKSALINAGGNIYAVGHKPAGGAAAGTGQTGGAAAGTKAAGEDLAGGNMGGAGMATGSITSAGMATGAGAPDGARLWNIGVRHPRPGVSDASGVGLLAAVAVADKAVVTSGDYERYFEYGGRRYHHILDPSTGWPPDATVSVTVISEDSVLADYLSTAIFVLGKEKGLELAAEYPGVEALVVDAGLGVAASPGFNGVIYE